MRKLDALFYVMLGILTVAVLVMLVLWVTTKYTIYLYLMLGAFGLYSLHIILTVVRGGKELRGGDAFRCRFLMLLNHIDSRVVYITYLGSERRVLRPSAYKKDYLVEFYEPDTDLEKLKKHIWYGLSEKDEAELRRKCIGGIDVPASYLQDIRGRKVLIQEGFLELAKNITQFSDFMTENEMIPYGD